MGRILLTIFGAVGILVLTYFSINAFDSDISPQTQALLSKKYDIPPRTLAGFKYFLGLGAPEHKDPLHAGEGIFQQLSLTTTKTVRSEYSSFPFEMAELPCEKQLCTQEEFKKHRSEIRMKLINNNNFVKRANTFIAYGSYGYDQAYRISAQNLTAVLAVTKYKLAQANLLLRDGDPKGAFRELEKTAAFFKESLQYPNYLISTMINLLSLSNIRNFVELAVAEQPNLAKSISPPFKRSLQLEIPLAEIQERTNYQELSYVHFFLQHNNDVAFIKDNFPNEIWDRYPWLTTLTALLVPYFIKRNETLNLHYDTLMSISKNPCLTQPETKCIPPRIAPISYVRNPGGKVLERIIGHSLISAYKKMAAHLTTLSKKFEP